VSARQSSFSKGEITPLLWARTDLQQYNSALRTCRNFLITPTGGAQFRPGTDFVCEVKDSLASTRLLKFVFSNAQALVLEFGNRYIRFISDGGPVIVAGVPLEVVSPYTTADLFGIRAVQSGDVITLTHPLYPVQELKRVSNTNWTLTTPTFGTGMLQPSGLVLVPQAGTAHTYRYVVTAISAETGEESLASHPAVAMGAVPTVAAPNKLSWNAVLDPAVPTPPDPPTITPVGGTALIMWYYRIVAHTLTGVTGGSLPGIMLLGGGTLTPTDYNHLTWPAVPDAVAYDIYRAGPFLQTGTPGTPAPYTPTTWGKIYDGIYQYIHFHVAPLTHFDDTGWAAELDDELPPQYADVYNVYRSQDGGPFGFLGAVREALWMPPITFVDDGSVVPDYLHQPVEAFTGFVADGDYPSVSGFYQGRQLYANTLNAPEKVWGSQTGKYHNFTVHSPLQEDDAVIFTLANAEISAVMHLLDLGKLVVGTEGGEWLIEGDSGGVFTPFGINARVGSYNGAKPLPPIKVDRTVLYVQALGNKVLELTSAIQYGYYTFAGKDLTLFSSHLFNGYGLVEWDYQQIPHYITWAVRSDGTLLGFTYLSDQELSAWHRHDTDGAFESVCVIPEAGEHRVYVIVRRTVMGVTRRYVERMRSHFVADLVADSSYMDSALEYDGRNASAGGTTLTLSGGTNWTYDEVLTLTASANEFEPGNVGDARVLRDAVGASVTVTIVGYTSHTVVTVTANRTVPVTIRGVAVSWDRAVARLAGLGHLEGKALAIFADGFVVGSPNNPFLSPVIVVPFGGTITLDQPYAHIRAGLPYIGDLETLDIDTPSGPSLKEERVLISRVGLMLNASRGIWVGPHEPNGTDPLIEPTHPSSTSAIAGLRELKTRRFTDPVGVIQPTTGYVYVDIRSEWTSQGRVFVRQVDPCPLTILALVPQGMVPPTQAGG